MGTDSESSYVDIGNGIVVKRRSSQRNRRPMHIDDNSQELDVPSDKKTDLEESHDEKNDQTVITVKAARQWEHQSHPADVIVHSFGMTLVDMIEGLISGTTGVITPSINELEGKPITLKEVETGLESCGEHQWKLDNDCYAYKETESDDIIFCFRASNLSTLMYKILECGAIMLYGTCDYLLIGRGIVQSFHYLSESGEQIDLRDTNNVLDNLETKNSESTQWGDELCLKSDPADQKKTNGVFEIKLKFYGENYSRTRHEAGAEIKAITRHGSRVVCHPGEDYLCLTGSDEEAGWIWHAYMLVDI